ncbi:hypothetical protein A0H81_11863 [Grifola frondosa]|uniref:Uncharacterized protein n=1 Tax=Grifola frondosa TaxID=5627 RepID=A0A1C7LWD5_GRIFR|nr:hypothetical protein A0H81_11863 [Grifola frondosa]
MKKTLPKNDTPASAHAIPRRMAATAGSSSTFRPSVAQYLASSQDSLSSISTSMRQMKQTQLSFAKAPRKSNPLPRLDQEIITISSSSERSHISISDSPSHISISSDSVVYIPNPPKRTSSSQAKQPQSTPLVNNSSVSATKKNLRSRSTTSKANASLTGRSQGPSQLRSSPQRRPRSQVPKSKSQVKRKFSDSDSEDEPATEHMLFCYDVYCAVISSWPLVPKDNVPSTRGEDSARTKSPPKKARLSSPELPPQPPSSGNDADVEELVPSSQSDEHELTMSKPTKKGPAEIKESIDKWRQDAEDHPPSRPLSPPPLDGHSTPPTDVDDIPMDVDIPGPGPSDMYSELPVMPVSRLCTPHSDSEVSMQLRQPPSGSTLATNHLVDASIRSSRMITSATVLSLEKASSSFDSPSEFFRALTPPPSDPVSLPATPVVLDEKSKTAKLIDEIKARAYAAAHSSPEEPELLEFKELESSDEELDDDFLSNVDKIDKGKGKTVTSLDRQLDIPSSPLSNLDSSPPSRRPSGRRYNLRRHSPAVTTTMMLSDAIELKPLREVARGEVRRWCLALQHAEATAAAAKRGLREEMDLEDDLNENFNWANEEAALNIVRQGARLGGLASKWTDSMPALGNDSDSGSENEDEVVEDADCEKILGEKGGKAVGRILAKDRLFKKAHTKGKRKARILGVPLWLTPGEIARESEDLEIEVLPSKLLQNAIVDNHPLLTSLRNAVDSNDKALLNCMLSTGLITVLEPEQCAILVPWLFNTVFFQDDKSLSDSSYLVLLQLSSKVSSPLHSGFSFALISQVLLLLGIRPGVLDVLGWKPASGIAPKPDADGAWKADMLYRLVSLVSAFTRGVPSVEIPDTMLSLFLIALDATTVADVKRDVMVAADRLSEAIEGIDSSHNVKAAVCLKIVLFAKGLSPLNQGHLISFFMGGCPHSQGMTRWIARCLLLDVNESSAEVYCDLPDLDSIVKLLSPPAGSEALFDIQGNSDKDDFYEDLACYLSLLAKVLTDIDDYVADEKNAPRGEATREKPPTPLEQIKMLLDELHGKIVDTRAAHLDRSRAKAAIQRLAFRVHYQRLASLKSGTGTRKPRNLHGYFASPMKST